MYVSFVAEHVCSKAHRAAIIQLSILLLHIDRHYDPLRLSCRFPLALRPNPCFPSRTRSWYSREPSVHSQGPTLQSPHPGHPTALVSSSRISVTQHCDAFGYRSRRCGRFKRRAVCGQVRQRKPLAAVFRCEHLATTVWFHPLKLLMQGSQPSIVGTETQMQQSFHWLARKMASIVQQCPKIAFQ